MFGFVLPSPPPTQVYSNPFVYPNILSPNSLHTKQNIGLRTWCLGYFIFCLINMILKHHIQTPIHLHLCTLCLKKYFNNSKRVEFSVWVCQCLDFEISKIFRFCVFYSCMMLFFRGRVYDRRRSPPRYSRSPRYARASSRSPDYYSPSPRRRRYSRFVATLLIIYCVFNIICLKMG